MFIVLIFVFGIGYWWVGNDLSRQDIVKLGICAQSSVFPVLAYHIMSDRVTAIKRAGF